MFEFATLGLDAQTVLKGLAYHVRTLNCILKAIWSLRRLLNRGACTCSDKYRRQGGREKGGHNVETIRHEDSDGFSWRVSLLAEAAGVPKESLFQSSHCTWLQWP